MTDRLARWISIFFNSTVLSLPIFLAFGYVSSRVPGRPWAIPMFLLVTGIPFAYLLIGRKRGWVSDLELSEREERPYFILISLGSDLLALGLLWFANGPPLLRALIGTYLCLAIVMFSTSIFWKISMHMAGVGEFSTALVFVFGVPALWAFLSLLLVAWARWHRRKHTPAQLAAGAIAGIAIALFVFGTTGKIV